MTKNRTSLNGTDEWLWKQHLICIEGAALSTRWKLECLVARPCPPASRSISRPSARDEKGIVLYLYHRFDRIFYSDYARSARARAKKKTANPFMIARRCLLWRWRRASRKEDSARARGSCTLIKNARVGRRGKTSGVSLSRVLRRAIKVEKDFQNGVWFLFLWLRLERKNRVISASSNRIEGGEERGRRARALSMALPSIN